MQTVKGACPVCRSEIAADDAFCQECGAEQKGKAEEQPVIAISTFPTSVPPVVSLASDLHKRSFKPVIAASIGFCLAVSLVVSIFLVTEKWAPALPSVDEESASVPPSRPRYTLASPVSKPRASQVAKGEAKRFAQPGKLAALPSLNEEPASKPSLSNSAPPSPPSEPDSSAQPVQTSEQKRSEKPDSSYTEGEMSKYNELLTSYFSRANASTAGGAKVEPPTFDEWVADGKPNF